MHVICKAARNLIVAAFIFGFCFCDLLYATHLIAIVLDAIIMVVMTAWITWLFSSLVKYADDNLTDKRRFF
jgi:hypothetical protein